MLHSAPCEPDSANWAIWRASRLRSTVDRPRTITIGCPGSPARLSRPILNPRNLMLLRDTLQAKGYRTIEATTGGEGVRMAGELHPDLILMDIRLPGVRTPSPPVVASM